MTGPRIGVDVGGTFTDVVLAAPDGELTVAKVPSTPADQSEGVLAGVEATDVAVADLERFAHGTTVATNTVLERDGARVVLVTTAGFRDLLVIGRQDRPRLYDQAARRPEPVVARGDVVEVAERVRHDGTVHTSLEEAEVARVVEEVAALAPDAVAISLLFSYAHPEHEQRLADAIAQRLDVPVSRSSDVLPTFREFERTSTTALNAYVAPRMARYLGSLEARLSEAGHEGVVEVQRSGGGTFAARLAARYPVQTLLSGPAAGAWGAAIAGRASGVGDLVAFDMGGTSTDVTLVVDGRPTVSSEGAVGGLPFGVPTMEIHTVGAGGGSVAWRDAGGALRVGPRSAGARPGPASYGHGGTEPTVTDANVHLGRLDPDVLLGGEMPLQPDLATKALERLGAELDLDVDATARGVLRVVEAEMVRALRVVSVEKGHDPRDFVLVPFGGAGSLHQGALARALGCRRVLVPANAGVLSAVGLLAAPVVAELLETRLSPLDDVDVADLQQARRGLEDRARDLLRGQGVTPATVEHAVDLRYRGQAFELTVAAEEAAPSWLAEAFHRAHHERYGWSQDDAPVELVNVRVRCSGPTPDDPVPTIAEGTGRVQPLRTRRLAVDDGEGGVREAEVAVLDRDRLGAGDAFDGPAIVVGRESTCWVEPWQHVDVDAHGALAITERGAA